MLIVANYLLGLAAAGPRARVAAAAAVVLDLAVLGSFKLLDALPGGGTSLLAWLTGRAVDWGALDIVLPVAISFVSFTLIAYVVDVCRGAPPERDLLHFAVFVAFFPRILAGPIVRGHEFLPQLRFRSSFGLAVVHMAVPLLVTGLLKKAVADQLAPVVRDGFVHLADYGSLALLSIAAPGPSSCTSTSPATRTWLGARRVCWASGCRATSSGPTARSPWPSSGAAGTSPWGRGCATTCTSRWGARATATCARPSTSSSR